MGALSDIKVLDLTRVLAGPYATMLLADLGAEIIKIEQPEKGDDSRAYGPYKNGESAYFMSLNRNKESITLNLKAPEGKEILNDKGVSYILKKLLLTNLSIQIWINSIIYYLGDCRLHYKKSKYK